jgi:hypothetical protein
MSATIHVNGEASIWTGTGAASALEELGVSVDGVEIDIETVKKPVIIDTYGENEYDFQYFGQRATVKVTLVVFDQTVLNKLLNTLVGTTAGTFSPAGSLIVAGGFSTRLLVKSTPAGAGVTGSEPCHNFPQVFLDTNASKFSTETTKPVLVFRAMPSQQLSSTQGVVLYNTTCS